MALDFLSPVANAAHDTPEERFSWGDAFQRNSYFGLLALLALLTYSYWNMLESTSKFWQDDQYSHGYLVPLIAVYLAWSMRPNPAAQTPPEGQPEETFLGLMPATRFLQAGVAVGAGAIAAGHFLKVPALQGVGVAAACLAGFAYVLIGQPFAKVASGERWAGLAILLAAYGLRVLGASYYSEPVIRVSFLFALIGALVMIGGWALARWAGPAAGFLVFMYPIPSVIEHNVLGSLQKLAAAAAEFVLVIMGQPVHREGNTIHVADVPDPLFVAEACSGLRMLTIFGGFAVACALLIRRPWWDRLIVLLSAVPIALISNVARIVLTALFYRIFPESEAVQGVIHDYAGLAMMPIGMGLLYLELKVLSTLSKEEDEISSYGGGALGHFGPSPLS